MLNELLYLDPTDLVGKLFCTFVPKSSLENTLSEIQNKYTIMYDKIFILEATASDEYICTYNIDSTNLSPNTIIDDTFLCHRVKAFNVLYTLNALNMIVCKLNNGIQDNTFKVDWQGYKNSILLTRNGNLVQINTRLHDILDFSKK